MRIYEAEVTSNIDLGETGVLSVSSNSFPGEKKVLYTSPYGGFHNSMDGEKAGFFAIPTRGEKVLIAQTVESDNFYFLAVVHQTEFRHDGSTLKNVKDAKAIPKETYKQFRGVPQKIVLKDPKGHKLTLSHAYGKTINNENSKAQLKSSRGKHLTLTDTPQVNRIELRNEFGDGLELLSEAPNPAGDKGSRHLSLVTQGYASIFADAGIDILVAEGTELNIENASTTQASLSSIPTGNVNITSVNKDINLTSRSAVGKIMIRAKGSEGLVQINSDGSIIIKAPSDNIFIEGDNINIKASSNLNIEAAGDVNIKAGGQANMSGSNATVSLSEDAIVDGRFVQLAPPNGVSLATGADSAEEIVNEYDE